MDRLHGQKITFKSEGTVAESGESGSDLVAIDMGSEGSCFDIGH